MLNLAQVERILQEELGDRVAQELFDRVIDRLAEADGRWQELEDESQFGYNFSIQCPDICLIGALAREGGRLRVFREVG
ncbi:hypothetical protein [Limnochorda pilosa]|uniref:Uncharacterized protein n=1 Tax=Limnochorda pilosa TaxID=1555112 RepID=A0A0K2SK46_LIMPI|nr:hypothetical protein [Limnochorda pilosa]BAS27488.1 hypothetical protein LIP_1642 [Limnochorda pilosa]